jgi:hypothetical protein
MLGLRADQKPWLILGKGPSYEKRSQFDLDSFRTLSLNHVVRDGPVFLAHMVDIDVVRDCSDRLLQNAAWLVLPWVPHVENSAAAGKTLVEWLEEIPVLKEMDAQGRLLHYHLGTSKKRIDSSPVVPVKYFSAEAALNILAMSGVKTVRTLGVDGGNRYGASFEDLRDKTLLVNGRSAFDAQFLEFAKTIKKYGVDYAPLAQESPAKVFVGCSPDEILPTRVLEYSIKKHATVSVEVFPLYEAGIEYPMPRDSANRPRTPFSFQRFLIPELCRNRGRALYLDADMQVFADIRELWSMDFDGADILTTYESAGAKRLPQFSVILLNCEALGWRIGEIVRMLDDGELNYTQLMHEFSLAKAIRAEIDPRWNSLEHFKEAETALLHYTDMASQPWVSHKGKYVTIWMRDLLEAIEKGFIPIDFVDEQIRLGNVRPSLRLQIDRKEPDPRKLPSRLIRELDGNFKAPYKSLLDEKTAARQAPGKLSLLKRAFRFSLKR